jgi:uncharacterized membrane protein YdbT with pleckstrin-like domain
MYIIKKPVVILLVIPVLLIIRNPILYFFPSDLALFLNFYYLQLNLVIAAIAFTVLVCRVFLYLFVEYGVTNKRLLMKRGIFRVVTAEIPVDRIESIYCIQGLLGKIFNYGTICISGIGGRMPVFYMVIKPYALRRKIVAIIEKNKAITVTHDDPPKPPDVKPPVVEEPIEYGTYVRISSKCCEKKGD